MKFRVLPILIAVAALLLVLKTTGLMFSGHYALGGSTAPRSQVVTAEDYRPTVAASGQTRTGPTWMHHSDDGLITGSVPPKAEKAPDPTPETVAPPPGIKVPPEGLPAVSPGQEQLNARLQQRRQELEARAHELDTREGLMLAAEQRLDTKLEDL